MDKLPNASNTSVNVNHNETVDSATINRPFNRLLENDIFKEGHVQDILSTIINEGLEGEIANFLGLDETYINGILNDIADNNGTSATLGDLDDVGIIDVEDKDIIRYEQGVGDFVNVSSEDDNNIDAYIEDFEYLNDITHEELSVEPTFEYQDDIRIYTYEYEGNLFKSGGDSINPNLIKGFYLDISLFGIVNNNASEGNGGVEWSVSCNYPDGEEYVVLKYHAENVDDDGGIGQLVFVPYNYKNTETFKITVRLESNQSDWVDTNGRDLNYLKISKIKAKNIDSNIDSEKNQQLINGSVDPNDAKIMSDGFIESGSSGGYQIWDSATNTNYSEWSDVIPIIVPERTAKTIIEFENYTITEGISSGDVGASSGAVGSAIGRVVIDWITEEISGNVNLYKGSGMSLIGSAVLQGNVNSTSSFNLLNNSLGGVDITLGIKTNFRRIAGLPIVIDNYLNIALGKVQYIITHYNCQGTDVESDSEYFCTISTSDTVPHGISVGPPCEGHFSIHDNGAQTTIANDFDTSTSVNYSGKDLTVIQQSASYMEGTLGYNRPSVCQTNGNRVAYFEVDLTNRTGPTVLRIGARIGEYHRWYISNGGPTDGWQDLTGLSSDSNGYHDNTSRYTYLVIDNYWNVPNGINYICLRAGSCGGNTYLRLDKGDIMYLDSTPAIYSIGRYFNYEKSVHGFNIPYGYMDDTNMGIAKRAINTSIVSYPSTNISYMANCFVECEDQSPEVPPPPPIPPGYVAITNDGTWSDEEYMGGRLKCGRFGPCSVRRTVSFSVNGVAELEWTKSIGKIGRFDEYYGGFKWRIRITDPNFTGPLTVTVKARTRERYDSIQKTVNYFVIDA